VVLEHEIKAEQKKKNEHYDNFPSGGTRTIITMREDNSYKKTWTRNNRFLPSFIIHFCPFPLSINKSIQKNTKKTLLHPADRAERIKWNKEENFVCSDNPQYEYETIPLDFFSFFTISSLPSI
jgi:hypothetical protein